MIALLVTVTERSVRSPAGVQFAETLHRLSYSLIALCLLGVGAVINFDLHVDGPHKPDPKSNYYLLLNSKEKELEETLKKSKGADRVTQRELAIVLSQQT